MSLPRFAGPALTVLSSPKFHDTILNSLFKNSKVHSKDKL